MERIVIHGLLIVCASILNYIMYGLSKNGDYRAITVILSALVGYFLGKTYKKMQKLPIALDSVKCQVYEDDGRIQKYLTNGAFARNFEQLEDLKSGQFKVRHILEKKEYRIQKMTFSQLRWEDLVKHANHCAKNNDYVTSWVESEEGAFVFFIQYR